MMGVSRGDSSSADDDPDLLAADDDPESGSSSGHGLLPSLPPPPPLKRLLRVAPMERLSDPSAPVDTVALLCAGLASRHFWYLSLHAASMVLQRGLHDPSHWNTCATNVSWAVCMMNTQNASLRPIPRKLKNLESKRYLLVHCILTLKLCSL